MFHISYLCAEIMSGKYYSSIFLLVCVLWYAKDLVRLHFPGLLWFPPYFA